MITTEIRNSIQLHANHFPWAPPRSARRMAVRLIRAQVAPGHWADVPRRSEVEE